MSLFAYADRLFVFKDGACGSARCRVAHIEVFSIECAQRETVKSWLLGALWIIKEGLYVTSKKTKYYT